MYKSEKLKWVILNVFVEEKAGDGPDGVKPKVKTQIVQSNWLDVFVGHGSFYEAEDYFDDVDDVYYHFNIPQSLLPVPLCFPHLSFARLVDVGNLDVVDFVGGFGVGGAVNTPLINFIKNHNKRRNDQIVNRQNGY